MCERNEVPPHFHFSHPPSHLPQYTESWNRLNNDLWLWPWSLYETEKYLDWLNSYTIKIYAWDMCSTAASGHHYICWVIQWVSLSLPPVKWTICNHITLSQKTNVRISNLFIILSWWSLYFRHKFLAEFLEVGGVLTVLEILGLKQAKEVNNRLKCFFNVQLTCNFHVCKPLISRPETCSSVFIDRQADRQPLFQHD